MIFAEGFPPGVDATAIGMWIVILGIVLGIYLKLRTWEKGLKGEGEKREISPLPLPVQMAKEFTSRDSFHKHAELNRQAHAELQLQINAIKTKMESDKTEIIDAGNERSEKIQDRISTGFEAIAGQIGELKGQVRNLPGGRVR